MNSSVIALFETLFDVFYLLLVWGMVILMTVKMSNVNEADRKTANWIRLAFILLAAGDTGQTRILVVWVAHGAGRAIIGIKTDRVIEVTLLDEAELKPLDEAELLRWSGSAIAGIGRRKGDVVSVLDLDRLFDHVALSGPDQALLEVA